MCGIRCDKLTIDVSDGLENRKYIYPCIHRLPVAVHIGEGGTDAREGSTPVVYPVRH